MVGCPVVGSLLPREWSYLYSRRPPPKSFLAPAKNLPRLLPSPGGGYNTHLQEKRCRVCTVSL